MPSRCRLYLISPPEPGPDFAGALSAALDAGDVACFQLRLKDVDYEVVRRAVRELMPLCQSRDVAFILNDRPDLAAKLGCDGVHVGQEDTPYENARRIMGADAIVGVTCHDSLDLAYTAADAGADYVAFGAFFESGTKPRRFAPELELLEHWQGTTTVPCVAIGGITAANCRPLVQAGADFLAVSAGVFAHPQGPAAAVRAFNDIFDEEAPDQEDPPLEG